MLDPDLVEYLTEYRLQAPTEPVSQYEGECNHVLLLFHEPLLYKRMHNMHHYDRPLVALIYVTCELV